MTAILPYTGTSCMGCRPSGVSMWISILVHLLRVGGVAEGGEAAGEKGSEARFLFSRGSGC